MTSSPLLPAPGALARDIALDRVKAASDIDWWTACRGVISRLAHTQKTFTTDDVWDGLRKYKCQTPEPRAMGAAMRAARLDGLIIPIPEWRISCRPACHCRPVRVWRSLVFPEPVDHA